MNKLFTKILRLYLSVHSEFEISASRGNVTKHDDCEFRDVKVSRFFHDGYMGDLYWKHGTIRTPVVVYFAKRSDADGMTFKLYNHVMTNLILEFPCIDEFYQEYLKLKLQSL